jgi:hypothetical protein
MDTDKAPCKTVVLYASTDNLISVLLDPLPDNKSTNIKEKNDDRYDEIIKTSIVLNFLLVAGRNTENSFLYYS